MSGWPPSEAVVGSLDTLPNCAGLRKSTVVFGVFSTQLSEEQFLSWGWRIPFVLSLVLIAVGLFIVVVILALAYPDT